MLGGLVRGPLGFYGPVTFFLISAGISFDFEVVEKWLDRCFGGGILMLISRSLNLVLGGLVRGPFRV